MKLPTIKAPLEQPAESPVVADACCWPNAKVLVAETAPAAPRPHDRDVLIVGAGPAGMISAVLLVEYGVSPDRIQIVDAKAAPDALTKATTLQPGVLRILEQAGVLERIKKEALPVGKSNFYAGRDRELTELDFAAQLTNIPQSKTEAILRERLAELGVPIHFGIKLDKLTRRHDGFDVELSSGKLSARFVIGADGTKSTVRRELGIQSSERKFPRVMAAVDLELDLDLPHGEHYNFFGDAGYLELVPMPGEKRFRATLILSNEKADGKLDHAQDQERLRTFLTYAGITLTDEQAAKLPKLSYFKVKERVATHYKKGNGFIIGDAAHEHSPAGAQGMNTGLADAQNLAWKLARVIDGSADPALLDTYEKERRPIAQHVVRSVGLNTRLLGLTGAPAAVRNVLLPWVMPCAEEKIARDVAQLDVHYRGAVESTQGGCCPKVRAGDLAPLPHPLPGDKGADHVLVFARDPSAAIEAYKDQKRTVLHLVADSEERAAALREKGYDVLVDGSGALKTAFGVEGDRVFVIRPDGFIANDGT